MQHWTSRVGPRTAFELALGIYPASAVEAAADRIRYLDPNHPMVSILEERARQKRGLGGCASTKCRP